MSGTVWVLRGAPHRKGERSRGKRELDGHLFDTQGEAEAWISQKYVVSEYYAVEHKRTVCRICTCGRPHLTAAGAATGKVLDPHGAMPPQAKRRHKERGAP